MFDEYDTETFGLIKTNIEESATLKKLYNEYIDTMNIKRNNIIEFCNFLKTKNYNATPVFLEFELCVDDV